MSVGSVFRAVETDLPMRVSRSAVLCATPLATCAAIPAVAVFMASVTLVET
jgi:hypothetical protein